jgi:hypothetical protein
MWRWRSTAFPGCRASAGRCPPAGAAGRVRWGQRHVCAGCRGRLLWGSAAVSLLPPFYCQARCWCGRRVAGQAPGREDCSLRNVPGAAKTTYFARRQRQRSCRRHQMCGSECRVLHCGECVLQAGQRAVNLVYVLRRVARTI